MTCGGVKCSFVGRARKLVAFTAFEWTFLFGVSFDSASFRESIGWSSSSMRICVESRADLNCVKRKSTKNYIVVGFHASLCDSISLRYLPKLNSMRLEGGLLASRDPYNYVVNQ